MLEQQPRAWQPVESLPLQRSDLGIASFAQAIVFAAMVILSFSIAVIAAWGDPEAMDSNSAVTILMGLTMIGGMGVGLSGLGLGIAALFQKGRQRTWAIVGALLNGLGLFLMGALMTLGFLMQQ